MNFFCRLKKRFFNKSLINYQKYKGFTLAEVLITLGVVGVIALMLIPIIQKQQEIVYVNTLKSAYTTINEGFKLLMGQEGVTSLTDTSFFLNIPNAAGKTYSSSTTGDYLKAHIYDVFKTVKTCDVNDSTTCAAVHQCLNFDATTTNYSYFKFYLNDSVLVKIAAFPPVAPVSTSWGIISDPSLKMNAKLGNLEIDVNGDGGPNVMGRDCFIFVISQDGIVPMGSYDYAMYKQALGTATFNATYWQTANETANCSTTVSSYGWSCAARIIESNWVMDY